MTVRMIASAVIAALLLVGSGCSANQVPMAGNTPTQAAQTTPREATAAPSAAELTQPLEQEQAEAAALAHAGVSAQEVTGLRSHYDRDDRQPHWDVEFRAGDWEYDYEVSNTGAVLSADQDREPVPAQPASTQPAPTQPASTQPADQTGQLTADQAKQIALDHAGLTAEQVMGLRAEPDYDRGGLEYDVEFRFEGWEYDYEIDAETGTIRTWDKEWDD